MAVCIYNSPNNINNNNSIFIIIITINAYYCTSTRMTVYSYCKNLFFFSKKLLTLSLELLCG